jgi:hypothetical protein
MILPRAPARRGGGWGVCSFVRAVPWGKRSSRLPPYPAVQGSFSVHSLRWAEPCEPIRNRATIIRQVGLRMGKRRTINVILRFCSYELEELDNLVNAYGGLPRSSLVNIALDEFLYSPKEQDFKMCRKHRVNLAIRPDKLSNLAQYAKAYGVRRTDLIHLAIRNFKQKYSTQDIP